NFGALKAASWSPVGTDTFAYALGAACVYFWLSRNVLGLVIATLANAFTWPSGLLVGCLLLAFPPGEHPLPRSPLSLAPEARRRTLAKIALAGLPTALVLAYLIRLETSGYVGLFDFAPRAAFPLAALTSAAFVFAAVLWLLPDASRELAVQI